MVWEDVVFGRHREPPPANLQGTRFRGSTLEHCFFTHANLTDADFRGCTIDRCDFRYAQFHRTTFEASTFHLCDMYRAIFFDGTVMRETVFKLVSLAGTLDGATGLRWSTFRGNDPPALVPEDEDAYRHFLEWTKNERGEDYPIEQALNERLIVAAGGYRNISAVLASRGHFDESGKAYVKARRLERKSAGWRFHGTEFQPVRWLGLWFADLLCGFGTNLWIILPWVAAVAVMPGLLYFAFGGVSNAHGLGDNLLFGLTQMTSATPHGLAASNRAVDFVGVLQWLLGVALLGLLGFVLGNKLRSS